MMLLPSQELHFNHELNQIDRKSRLYCNIELLCLMRLLVEDFLVTVRFITIATATLNAVGKDFFEQQDKAEPSHLLAGTCFWLPDASCSLCLEESMKPPKPPLLEPNPNQ